MGTDIHGVWQAKKGGCWVDVESTWEQDRHYFLFSWLADVRNGYGFAGSKTYEPVKPISEPKGLPADFELEDGEYHKTTIEAIDPRRREYLDNYEEGNPKAWLGDHSHSWLTADEIMEAKRPTDIVQSGVLSIEKYKAWDKHSVPESYCSGVSGQNIVVSLPDLITKKTTHVQCEWIKASDELDYFIDEVKRLKEIHGEVRLVFGFDS